MEKVLVFGGGRFGREIIEKISRYKEVQIIGILDNYLKEDYLGDIRVYRPEKVSQLVYDYIILAVDVVDEVVEQLLLLGVNYFKINTSFIINKGIGARDIFLKHFAEEIYRKNIEGSVAEAGVFKGSFAAKINKIFPDRTLYLLDTFEGFDQRDIEMEEQAGTNSLGNTYYFKETSEQAVMKRMSYPDKVVIRKGYIPETLEGIEDRFCFVNLDLDLYKPTLSALDFFYDRMVKGGGILVHDFYNDYTFPNLRKAVIEFVEERNAYFFPIGDGLSVFIIK